ncbi:MAG TPA: replicative DNA helicase [Solirubrobacteraceae bacterium]|nr:replicative DNA helicase [Solirubrobacteraceae bacterium]
MATVEATAPRGSSPNAGPPHNLEAEESVIGAILLSDRALYGLVIEEGLRADDFYREQHRLVYQAILDLYDESRGVDTLTVAEHLRQHGTLEQAGGEAAIHALAGSVPAAGNARHYAKIVRDNALMRRLQTSAYQVLSDLSDRTASPRELVEQAERRILEVGHDDRQKDFRSIQEVLDEELDKLHRLSLEGTSLTGVPSGFQRLDELTGGFQRGNLIIIAARPSMGKCLPGSTLIYDPTTGARRRLDEAVEAIERGEEVPVATLGPDLKLRASRATAAFRNGRRATYRMTTRLGRTIEATGNHPLLTLSGWKRLDALTPGSRIAVPRRLPRVGAETALPDAEVVLLAALIADGNLSQSTPRFCFGADSPVLAEVQAAAKAFGVRLTGGEKGHGTATLSAGRGSGANPVREMCERHGLWGLKAAEKFVPAEIFGLNQDQVVRFLSVLYGCDGHVHATARLRQIGYTTISERLARDVQHLLLRLGIVSRIRTLRREVYEGTGTTAREVLITDQEGILNFCCWVGAVGKEEQVARALTGLETTADRSIRDTIPRAVWDRVLAAKGERPWAEVSAATGRPRNHNWHVGTRPLARRTMGELAAATEDPALADLATSDVWWDEVASVEYVGTQETFDVTVPETHNFVAADLVVHNSALVANIAENAALEHGHPVALFSLEMSESELAQRFVASQASIKGEDLRKGRVAESVWPKITKATNKLAQAPLYIDDSSDVGLLEIRAKARRLHAQKQVGLIIVDYLQLLRADSRIENRVEQVGQMSRGLKILARELDVPVIALSQLNRGVEARHDKRPLLSDLRESGSIEQDADLVMFIYRDEYYNEDSEREGEADLIVSKHRNGALGDVTLTFRKEFPKFMNFVDEDRFA